jgi:hypothetical protein
MSLSLLVLAFPVKHASAITNFFGSSTFTQLFLDIGFMERAVNLDLPQINLKVSFDADDIPAPGVLTILTSAQTASTSISGHPALSDVIELHWRTNAPESPEFAELSVYTDLCKADSALACAFEQNIMGQIELIPAVSDATGAHSKVRLNSRVQLVLVPRTEPQVSADPGYMSDGYASWYAYKNCDCAASPDFPKGSYVKVTRTNDPTKSVVVRINDFGPERDIHPDRVIDLDKVAFQKIAPLGAGLTHVTVEPVDAPPAPVVPLAVSAPTPAPVPIPAESSWSY